MKINKPTKIMAAGKPPKIIEEFIGQVNTGAEEVSIARMKSPSGWSEPGQTAEFDEYTVVLKGALRIEMEGEVFDVGEGEALVVRRGTWVRYSTPAPEGGEYIAVCTPAFSPDPVKRDG